MPFDEGDWWPDPADDLEPPGLLGEPDPLDAHLPDERQDGPLKRTKIKLRPATPIHSACWFTPKKRFNAPPLALRAG